MQEINYACRVPSPILKVKFVFVYSSFLVDSLSNARLFHLLYLVFLWFVLMLPRWNHKQVIAINFLSSLNFSQHCNHVTCCHLSLFFYVKRTVPAFLDFPCKLDLSSWRQLWMWMSFLSVWYNSLNLIFTQYVYQSFRPIYFSHTFSHLLKLSGVLFFHLFMCCSPFCTYSIFIVFSSVPSCLYPYPCPHTLQVLPPSLGVPWMSVMSRLMDANSSGTNQRMMVASLSTTMR